jgi:hypothetical protein
VETVINGENYPSTNIATASRRQHTACTAYQFPLSSRGAELSYRLTCNLKRGNLQSGSKQARHECSLSIRFSTMMFGLGRHRPRWSRPWIVIAIIGAVLLFIGVLVVNVAGQGYEPSLTFRSTTYNLTSPSFPANFLRESLKNKSSCEGQLIQQNDGMHLWIRLTL